MLLLGAFFLGFLMDWVYARYTCHAAEGKALKAALFSALIYLFGFAYTKMIINDLISLVFAFLVGGFIGTYIGVKKHNV